MLIYTQQITPRLSYVCNFLSTFYQHSFRLSSKLDECEKDGALNYSGQDISNTIRIPMDTLLSETDIKRQTINIGTWGEYKTLFSVNDKREVPFDIFSAIFFLISRYEEYLPHTKDKHGRYESNNSILVKENLIETPIIDLWLKKLAVVILEIFGVDVWKRNYSFTSTIDIDKAYAYKYQGLLRRQMGFLRAISNGTFKARRAVLQGKKEDPFDTFQYLKDVHQKHELKPRVFMQVGKHGPFDKNLKLEKRPMKSVVADLKTWTDLGVHPSYRSLDNPPEIKKEIERLQKTSGTSITKSRQHFLRFNMPQTYEHLIAFGITEDYSMGYPDRPGYRAGTSSSFRFYNLKKEEECGLIVYPLQLMDVTLSHYLRLTKGEAKNKIKKLIGEVKKIDGSFIALWHNSSFSSLHQMEGWHEVFEFMMKEAAEK